MLGWRKISGWKDNQGQVLHFRSGLAALGNPHFSSKVDPGRDFHSSFDSGHQLLFILSYMLSFAGIGCVLLVDITGEIDNGDLQRRKKTRIRRNKLTKKPAKLS